MTRPTIISLFMAAIMIPVHAGPEHLIKKSAKDLRDQNNERQGVPPPSQGGGMNSPGSPAQPATVPSTPPRPAGPALSQQAAGISTSLATISQSSEVTNEQREELIRSLTAAARGSVKPSESKISKLGKDLAMAVAGVDLSSSQRSTLAEQLELALSVPQSAKEMEDLAGGVLDALRDGGAGKVDATVVANDVKSIIAQIQRGGAK